MNRCIWALSLLFLSFTANAVEDPFKNIELHKLENGMNVVLSPSDSAKNAILKIRVGVGYYSEDHENIEVSHILEHALFRDGSLEEGKTYLQLIEEKGGRVNAYVRGEETAYYTTVPAEKLDWVLIKFKEMIFDRSFVPEDIELAKSAVVLEIGKPFVLNEFFDFDLTGYFSRNYFPRKGYWESEFGYPPSKFSSEEERLSVKKISLSHVEKHYQDYYYPANMTLFVSGKFDTVQLLSKIKEQYGSISNTSNLQVKLPQSKRINKDYIELGTTHTGTSRIAHGVKYYDVSLEEFLSLNSYMDFVAHRLMIELRNKKGETYSAQGVLEREGRDGYSLVSFETPSDKFHVNKEYLLSLFEQEVNQGDFSDEKVQEAKDLFLKQSYEISDVDARTGMRLAEHKFAIFSDFGVWESPHKVIKNIEPDTYRENLNHIFNSVGFHSEYNMPPLFFKYDLVIIFLVTVFLTIFLYNKSFSSFKEKRVVHWDSGVYSTPGRLVECIAAFMGGKILTSLVVLPVSYLSAHWDLFSSSQFIIFYLGTFLSASFFTLSIIYLLSLIPSKIENTNTYLFVYTMSSKCYIIDIEEVESVELVGWSKKLLNPSLLRSKFIFPTLLFGFRIFTPSLLIKLKDSNKFILNLRNPTEVKDKIMNCINREVNSSLEDCA